MRNTINCRFILSLSLIALLCIIIGIVLFIISTKVISYLLIVSCYIIGSALLLFAGIVILMIAQVLSEVKEVKKREIDLIKAKRKRT